MAELAQRLWGVLEGYEQSWNPLELVGDRVLLFFVITSQCYFFMPDLFMDLFMLSSSVQNHKSPIFLPQVSPKAAVLYGHSRHNTCGA